MRAIVGVSAFHGDSSACLIQDNKLIFATEEERLNRIKHWAGFPMNSVDLCLSKINVNRPLTLSSTRGPLFCFIQTFASLVRSIIE